MTVKELSQLYYLNRETEMDQVRLDNLWQHTRQPRAYERRNNK